MNRELKFRIWNSHRQKYIFKNLNFEGALFMGMMDSSCRGLLEESEFFTVEQFTGLVDKEGAKVYEGDIVEFGMSHSSQPFPKLRVVEFCSRQLIYKLVEVGEFPVKVAYLYEAAPQSTRWIKIIGNIHENKDLLEYKE